MPAQITPISAIIKQTAQLLQQDLSAGTPFFGLLIVENQGLLALFAQENMGFTLLSLAEFLAQDYSQYYDLAVLVFDNHVTITPDMQTAIQRCRDLFARHSLLFAPVFPNSLNIPSTQDFIAFGFSKISQAPVAVSIKGVKQEFLAWQFNLYDYKQLPDWFNSRFWANPENWNKFRW